MESRNLSRTLWLAILTPALLLVALGAVLGVQILRMTADAQAVDRTDQVILQAAILEKQISEQESALRGFLLTGERSYAEQYHRVHPLELITELEARAGDKPVQLARLAELRSVYGEWRAFAAPLEARGSAEEARSPTSMLERRQKMDEVRELLTSFIETEQQLRDERAAASAQTTGTTKTLFVLLFAGATAFIAFFSRRQLVGISSTFQRALDGERTLRARGDDDAWVRKGVLAISTAVRGDLSLDEVGQRALSTLVTYLGADVGAFFSLDGDTLRRRAAIGLDARVGGADAFPMGQGLVGRAAQGEALLRVADVASEPDAPEVRSGTRSRLPRELVLVPLRVNERSYGVLEVGLAERAGARVVDLLERIGEAVAIALRSAEYNARLRELLEESQRQAEELQAQQEELRIANKELEEHGKVVREAQVRLEERQEELTAANAQLEAQAKQLESARGAAMDKAGELERTSRYKSEFLANMSHELRTPLNSSLILSRVLAENKDGNLTAEQVKFAETIHAAGNDLLTLINDTLDLAKVEAGKAEVRVAEVSLARIAGSLARTFEPMAKEKRLRFAVEIAPRTPEHIATDQRRLEQILKNLCSNALKFTPKGEVVVHVSATGDAVRFAVRDTGIGIPREQQEAVFEAFRQLDGASTRKYGGTGLGLSISRELAVLLGGDIHVESDLGKGSTFTLTIPRALTPAAPAPAPSASTIAPIRARTPDRLHARSSHPPAAQRLIEDDRDSLDANRRLLLVIEDDARFAQILLDVAHEREFQCVVAGAADEGVSLAQALVPDAVILDLSLPDHTGLSVLDRLKHTPATRHIPVHIVTVADEPRPALSMGAAGFHQKPVARQNLLAAFERLEHQLEQRVRRLLVVEDDAVQRDSLVRLLTSDGVEIAAVGTVKEALDLQQSKTFDCVVTDLALPDASGLRLLETMAEADGPHPPVIVYTGRSLSEDEEQRLRRYSSSIIVKGARSPERLLDEVTLFLHQVESELPPDRQRMLKHARDRESVLDGRTILVVEDDVRNIFALSSVLEPRGAKVVVARNGVDALSTLAKTPSVDLVLMDIMMPEMDGITAMKEIRKRPEHARLPIIALSAKAMRADQERALEAGANDYVSKPLDVEKLLSLLRVWMPR